MAEQLFGQAPPTMLPVRWQKHQLLGAWRAGSLMGLADVACGLDSNSPEEPDYRPIGLLRFLSCQAARNWSTRRTHFLRPPTSFGVVAAWATSRPTTSARATPAFKRGQACCRVTGPTRCVC